MKRVLVGGMVMMLAAMGCAKGPLGGLKYGDINLGEWLQATVIDAKQQKRVLWFQVFDQKEDASIQAEYKKLKEQVAGYPANINKDKWIWILINNRVEIRLLADEERRDFQSTERLTDFIKRFDLKGLEKIAGERVQGKAFRKYIPKIDQ